MSHSTARSKPPQVEAGAKGGPSARQHHDAHGGVVSPLGESPCDLVAHPDRERISLFRPAQGHNPDAVVANCGLDLGMA
jgi:hypothetical protein